MWKQLLIMILILAGLIAWERSLAERTARTREAGVRIQSLLGEEDLFAPDRPVAAFRLERGDLASLDPSRRTVHLYAHAEGVWRCVTAYGAVALNDYINALIPKLIAAEGHVQARGAVATEFGFDTEEMFRLAICGPDALTDPAGDVIYSIDIGRSIPETGGSYVRPTGTDEVWMVNVDLREELETSPAPQVPPMLDPRIVPEAWPGFEAPGVDRIVIEVPDELPLELQRVERDLTPEQRAAGEPRWEWTVTRGESVFTGDAFQIFSYGRFLMQAPYAGILSPHAQRDLGFDDARARITLRSAHGMHMQLLVGRRAPRGGIPIINTFSQSILEVDGAIVDLMIPEMDMLLVPELGNPWDAYLRQAER